MIVHLVADINDPEEATTFHPVFGIFSLALID
jgi:hypothetical protein